MKRFIRYDGYAYEGGPVTTSENEIVTGPFIDPESGHEYLVVLDNEPHYTPPHHRMMQLVDLTFCQVEDAIKSA